jgi:hypothetical protein
MFLITGEFNGFEKRKTFGKSVLKMLDVNFVLPSNVIF